MTAQTETPFSAYPKDPVAEIRCESSSCGTVAGLSNRGVRCHEKWIDDPLHRAWNESVNPEADIFGLPFTLEESSLVIVRGNSWIAICDSIIQALPREVYLTLDIDGLDPAYCQNTGTPVPGGLSFAQLSVLLHRLVESGRILRGFDLVEVGGHPADALIAAHLLYLLCGLVEHR